jgi:outer membrane receptor protein involved in Fe transport
MKPKARFSARSHCMRAANGSVRCANSICSALGRLIEVLLLMTMSLASAIVGFAQAAPSAAASAPRASETVELSVFEVSATKDASYSALNTNSVTRFAVELNRLPITADIFTEAFISDVGATTIEDLFLRYGTSAGFGGSDPGAGADVALPGDNVLFGNINLKLRGLDSGGNRRNGFLQASSTDMFSVERVEVIRGPQALLYGGGGAGGVLNAISRTARFSLKSGGVQMRVDQEGALRGTFNVNYGGKRLALHVAGVADDRKHERLFIGGRTFGGYAQLAWRVGPRTTLRLEGEEVSRSDVNPVNALTLSSPAGGGLPADPRNGAIVRMLLARGEAGDLVAGKINWGNVDSFGGRNSARRFSTHRGEIMVETRWNRNVSTQFAGTYDDSIVNTMAGPTTLVPAGRAGNPLGTWALSYRPADSVETWLRRGVRGALSAEFALFGGRARNQLLLGGEYSEAINDWRSYSYYQADGNGIPIVNPAQATNATLGRVQIPVQWISVQNGPVRDVAFPHLTTRATVDNLTYVRDFTNRPGLVAPTDANPIGIAGSGSYWQHTAKNSGIYIADFTTWLDGRLTTLAGYRVDGVEVKRYDTAQLKYLKETPRSLNLGVNYRLRESLRLFYGFSDSFNVPRVVQFGPTGDIANPGKGTGHEFGVKFATRGDAVSGSLSYYTVESDREQVLVASDDYTAINPAGINGQVQPSSRWIGVSRETSGAELILTAEPARGWRSRLSLSLADGRIGDSASYGQMYNDEFHTDGRGGLIYSDGSPLLVKVNPADSSATAPTTQLTVAMMNTRGSPYFADLDPVNGRIRNANALGLRTTSANGATVATGRAGLPISSHQLAFTDPNQLGGTVMVTTAGESTTGYAKYAAVWTNNYTFSDSRIRGLSLGSTLSFRADDRSYYYTQIERNAAGAVTGSRRVVYSLPDLATVDFFTSYEWKFGKRARWRVQVNANNVFNHYQVVVLPNATTGEPRTARFTTQPRYVFLTNSLSF